MAAIEPATLTDRQRTAFTYAALAILLDGAGGSLTFTEAEYNRVLERYGGRARVNIRFEVTREVGRPDAVLARIENKRAQNAELAS